MRGIMRTVITGLILSDPNNQIISDSTICSEMQRSGLWISIFQIIILSSWKTKRRWTHGFSQRGLSPELYAVAPGQTQKKIYRVHHEFPQIQRVGNATIRKFLKVSGGIQMHTLLVFGL